MFQPKIGFDKSSEDLTDSEDFQKIEYEEYECFEVETS